MPLPIPLTTSTIRESRMKHPLFILLLCSNSIAFADSAFDGAWKTDVKTAKVTGKPDAFLLTKDEYVCSACSPELRVKADGADHAVTGHDYYDTVSAKITGPRSDEIVMKKSGKVFARYIDTVSADGNTLTTQWTNHSGAKEASGTTIEKRVSPGPEGSHPVSGSWQQAGFDANDALRLVEFRMTADAFQLKWNGQTYNAGFDGKDVPFVGDPGNTTVSVKKLNERSIEETDRRGGKIVDRIRYTVSPEGKQVAVHDEDLAHGQTITYTLVKQ
jgi:hypothetical protein